MCLALPAEVIAREGDDAVVDVDGVRTTVSLAVLPDVAVGDFVVIHVGYALSKIDPETAEAQRDAMRRGSALGEEARP